MIESIAASIVLVFGLTIALLCVYGVFSPSRLMQNVMTIWNRRDGMVMAVLVRLLLGLNLLFAAAGSRYPTALLVLGALTIFAAAVLLLLGRQRVDRLIDWAGSLSGLWLRLWLLLGLGFAVFLVHAVT